MTIYESSCAAESTFDFGDGEPIRNADLDRAISNFTSRLKTIKETAGADSFVLALSCPTRRYFRHDIDPTYKANRASRPAPLCLRDLRAYAEATYECVHRPALEADDVVGILATWSKFRKSHGEPVIASGDKDLDQIPGLHVNTNKIVQGVYSVTPEQGLRKHLWQTLVGDRVDNYPGCPKVGPVKADKALDSRGCSWSTVVGEFTRRGLTEEHALVQARLARILTASDWDWENKKPKLWSPN